MSRSTAQLIYAALIFAAVFVVWPPLSAWLQATLSIGSTTAYSVAFVVLLIGAALAVRFVRQWL